jgi:hypothetical protein
MAPKAKNRKDKYDVLEKGQLTLHQMFGSVAMKQAAPHDVVAKSLEETLPVFKPHVGSTSIPGPFQQWQKQ